MPRRALLASFLLALALPSAAHGARHIALGVSVGDPARRGAVARVERVLGRSPGLIMWYQSFAEPLFYSSQPEAVHKVGAIPMITWDPNGPHGPVPLRDIATGRWDSYLHRSARAARADGRPIFIRFAHEMNLLTTVYRAAHPGDSARRFVAAWRHVVDVFRSMGADNVRWVWSPNIDCGGECPFTAFFPGDRWVDWVALDGYNVGTSASWSHWTSLGDLFRSSYRTLADLSTKPMMIAETGSTETGGSKAAWIRSGLLHEVPHELPRVRAVVWFDQRKEQPWQIDSSPASLRAFQTVAAAPVYATSSGARNASAGLVRVREDDRVVDRGGWRDMGLVALLGALGAVLVVYGGATLWRARERA